MFDRTRTPELAIICLVISVVAPALCGRADRAAHDAVWRARHGLHLREDLVFLDVERVPVDKPALARAIGLAAREGARLVTLDFAFPRRVPGDEPVLAAVQQAGAILGFRILNQDGQFSPSFPAEGWQPRDLGFVDTPVDGDGVVRRAELFRRDAAGVTYRSLALTTFLHLRYPKEMATPAGRAALLEPAALDRAIGIDHDGGAIAFPAYYGLTPDGVMPLSQLAVPETEKTLVQGGFFRDKIVLVGWLGSGSRDVFRVPTGEVPGIMLHAAVLDALFRSGGVRRVPVWPAVALATLVGALVARRRAWLVWVAAAGCLALGVGAQLQALAPLPLASMLCALVCAGLAARRPRAPVAPPVEVVGETSPGDLPAVTSPGPTEDLETHLRAATDGRYGELRPLTKGGMGQIFVARDLRLDRSVVVKAMTPELARAGGEYRQRFVRESRLQARVAAAGLPVILDSHAEAAQPFVVMEYVEGEHLQALLKRRGALPAREVIALGRELAGMLAVLHRNGVVHRDLKPLNLMIDRTGRLRLLDLGLATTDGEESLTAAGRTMGTPGYMPPEQERGQPCHASADVYAFGAVLFELLTSCRPVNGLRTDPVEFTVLPSPEPLVRVAAPPALADLVLRCLAPEPRDRPRSFRAIDRALGTERVDRAVIERIEALRRFPRLAPAGDETGGRWDRLLQRVRVELTRGAPADDATGVALPAPRAGGRLTRVLDQFRVPVAARLHAVLARLPLQITAAYGAGEAPALPTPYPALAMAHLDTLARLLAMGATGARLRIAVEGSGAQRAVTVDLELSASDARLRAVWDGPLAALVRELDGAVTAREAGCALRLPVSAAAWAPRA